MPTIGLKVNVDEFYFHCNKPLCVRTGGIFGVKRHGFPRLA